MQLCTHDIGGSVISRGDDMATDTITVKFRLTADDFDTIQSARRVLSDVDNKAELIALLSDTMSAYLAGNVSADFQVETELRSSKPRETKSGQRQPIPQVKNGHLTFYDPDAGITSTLATVNSDRWFAWLDEPTTKSFRYVKDVEGVKGAQFTFTAMKRADGKWYAHKRLKGKLRRKYLGLSDNLSATKLEAVAIELAQYELQETSRISDT